MGNSRNEFINRMSFGSVANLLFALHFSPITQDLDIPRVVGQLRHQRDNIIPSLAQYKFIYSLLIHSLKQTRLI